MIEYFLAPIAVLWVGGLLTYRIVWTPTADDRLAIAMVHLLIAVFVFMGLQVTNAEAIASQLGASH